jgi:hypothetical protein
MAMFHSEPNRATPLRHIWFSVETPQVFREYKLPADNAQWTKADEQKIAELEHLAERHRTYIHRSDFRRG